MSLYLLWFYLSLFIVKRFFAARRKTGASISCWTPLVSRSGAVCLIFVLCHNPQIREQLQGEKFLLGLQIPLCPSLVWTHFHIIFNFLKGSYVSLCCCTETTGMQRCHAVVLLECISTCLMTSLAIFKKAVCWVFFSFCP